MRVQLTRVLARGALLVGLLAAAGARADGTISVRGAYYKERATRVQQPMVDATLQSGERGTVDFHALVDSITSASAAAGASGGTEFTERRYQLGGGYRHAFDRARVGGGIRLSNEPDYVSAFAQARVELDLAQQNTTLGFSIGQGRDSISNAGAQGMTVETVRGTLNTTFLSASVSQVLSESAVVGAGYDVSYLDGFQENAYRLVPAGGQLELERVPDVRVRHALRVSGRTYIAASATTLIGAYRFYLDDWGVRAHTPEARVVQGIGEHLDVTVGYRYYRQGKADFYQAVYDSADPMEEPFLTADVKLSRLHSHKVGGGLGVVLAALGIGGTMGRARLDLVFDYMATSTHLGSAVIGELGLTVPLAM